MQATIPRLPPNILLSGTNFDIFANDLLENSRKQTQGKYLERHHVIAIGTSMTYVQHFDDAQNALEHYNG